MNRRQFALSLLGAATVCPGSAGAQKRVFKVGSLSPVAPFSPQSPMGTLLARSLAEVGHVVGSDLVIEARGAGGRVGDLPGLAQSLAAARVDVIVTNGYPAAAAAKATGLPTVVTHAAGDPVATGLIASLARPGGNVTGISDNAAELSGKRLQILKEVSPGIRRVAMLWNKTDRAMTLRYEASAAVAESVGVTVQPLGVAEPDDFADAFAAMKQSKPDAIFMVADSLTILNRSRVFDFANAERLPAMFEYENLARDGGLMSYGPDFAECFSRAAALTDRIFKGSAPGDVPFEQPTRYRFVINLKTAKAIGLDVPAAVLARADEVIE